MVGILSVGRLLGGSILGGFSPRSLFANGEQGGFYDFSDLSVMFQDAAGTTPVTAVEQPVGLVLDKSRGLVLGSEIISNGTFDTNTTGWTASSSSLAIDTERLKITSSAAFGYAHQAISTTVGKWYKISFTITNGDATACYVFVGIATNLSAENYDSGAKANGTHTAYFLATATTTYVKLVVQTASKFAFFDNISVRELPGAHLSQSTAAARPVLSARVNIIPQYSEDISNAAWTKTNATAPNATTLQDTNATGFHFVKTADTISYTSGVSYTLRVRLEKGTVGFGGAHIVDNAGTARGCSINLTTGDIGTPYGGATAVSSADGSGWVLTITASAGVTGLGNAAIYMSTSNALASYTGTGSGTIRVYSADLRPANAGVGLPAYQRVGAATDYDTTGFPLYLKFDGTDDFLQSSTITPGSVDKAQVFAGVRKLSDAAAGVVAEYSNNVGSQNGSFLIDAPDTPAQTDYGFYVRGTIANEAPANGFAAPDQAVLTMQADISAASNRIIARRNAVQTGTSGAASLGTGNFGTYPLYIGRRDGTSLPFNGNLYQLLVRFSAANLDAATITATETWVNSKTLAY